MILIFDWNNINNQILYIHHQISVLLESNAMIHTCNYFDDVCIYLILKSGLKMMQILLVQKDWNFEMYK